MALNARLKKLEALAEWLELDGQMLRLELLMKIAKFKQQLAAHEAAKREARAAEERRAAEWKRVEAGRKAAEVAPPPAPRVSPLTPPSPLRGATSPEDGGGKAKPPPAPAPMPPSEPFQPLNGMVRWVPVEERSSRRYDDYDDDS
jgi:hypothetical protein